MPQIFKRRQDNHRSQFLPFTSLQKLGHAGSKNKSSTGKNNKQIQKQQSHH